MNGKNFVGRYIVRKRPEFCPICKGEGEYKGKTCHGCNGKGWILIDESYWNYSDDCRSLSDSPQPFYSSFYPCV